MTTIRPQPPQLPAAQPASGGNARAAFFQAALAKSAPVAAPAPAAAKPQPPAITPQRLETQPEPQAPQRFLRPGSLLDIKV